MTQLLRESPGRNAVVVYLKDVKAMKRLPVSYNVQIEDGMLAKLAGKFGGQNVKVVERVLKNF